MYYLGFSFGYHDSSVCICSADGEILGIYSEERFRRIKHDSGFPSKALSFLIDKHCVTSKDILKVYFYEDPVAKISRQFEQFKSTRDFGRFLSFKKTVNPIQEISDSLNIDYSKVTYISHHESHLYTAMTLADCDVRHIMGLTVDGVGEYETTCLWLVDRQSALNNKIVIGKYPNSLGLFYSALTCFLGFEVNDAEFKVMGLAAYGSPIYMDEMAKMISYHQDLGLIITNKYFSFKPNSPVPFTSDLIRLLGSPAKSSEDYAENFSTDEQVEKNADLKRFADIAASIQTHLTNILMQVVKQGKQIYPAAEAICYAGGVALNTKTNQSIFLENLGSKLLIPPDPGDGGSSLGAVNMGLKAETDIVTRFDTPYLGYDISDDILYQDLFTDLEIVKLERDQLIDYVSELLSQDNVVGWVQGRAEFGPRALGNRSILANPKNVKTQQHVNRAVKFREPFRPFAPVVLDNHMNDLFDVDIEAISYKNSPAYYMLSTFQATNKAYQLIPACIHVDGTSRVQLLRRRDNALLYNLIDKFRQKTGIPALLNTSFNLRGEPIVNNSFQAIYTFNRSGLDLLVIGNYAIKKKSHSS